MILEDDVIFTKSLDNLISALEWLKDKDYIFLYLSANLYGAHVQTISPILSKISNVFCAHSYIVNCKYLNYLINGIQNSKYEVDVYYKEVQQAKKCYILKPGITKQGAGFSNILDRNVVYETIG